MPRLGSKEKIRQFLLANIGRVVESHELQAAAGGAVQYSRRLRELREQEGWKSLVIWECQTKDERLLVSRLARFLGSSGLTCKV